MFRAIAGLTVTTLPKDDDAICLPYNAFDCENNQLWKLSV